MLTEKLRGKEVKIVKDIEKLSDDILGGNFLAIDPASKSAGYALFSKGELVESGSIEAPEGPIAVRLDYMRGELAKLIGRKSIGAVAVEKVRSHTGHVFLTWSAGTLVSATKSPKVIEITTTMWKKNIDPKKYLKSDEQDAIEIGRFVVTIAKELKG